jgi:hypothetical protein
MTNNISVSLAVLTISAVAHATYILAAYDDEYYKLNPTNAMLSERFFFRTSVFYNSLSIDNKNKRFFWAENWDSSYAPYHFSAFYGYSLSEKKELQTPPYKVTDLTASKIFYDNARDKVYAFVRKDSATFVTTVDVSKNGNMTLSTDHISEVNLVDYKNLNYIGYDDSTHTWIIQANSVSDQKLYIVRFEIDTGRVSSRIAVQTDSRHTTYFLDAPRNVINVVAFKEFNNGTYIHYTIDLKSGEFGKETEIWNPATEKVIYSQDAMYCFNYNDNHLVMSIDVGKFGEYKTNFIVTDLNKKTRVSRASMKQRIDVKLMLWVD